MIYLIEFEAEQSASARSASHKQMNGSNAIRLIDDKSTARRFAPHREKLDHTGTEEAVMAMFTSHHTGHHAPKSHSSLSAAWGIVTDGIAEVRASWRRRKTAEMIEGLSPELRKDIGWPTSDILMENDREIRH